MSDPRALHARLFTIDTHIDIPWPDRGDAFGPSERRVDLAKMQAGGLKAGCFAAYVPQGPRTAEAERAAFARAQAMLAAIGAMAGSRNGIHARIARSAAEIEAAAEEGALAIVPAVENGYAIGTELDRLDALAALGARYLTLTHNGHNALGDAAIPRADLGDAASLHGGLSEFGRAAIARLNALGMLVDVSHAAKSTMLEAISLSQSPVVATHASIHAICPHPRNLDDEQLDALAATGGVVQITAVPAFLRAHAKENEVGPADFADHVDYAVRRIGIAHVGISSDFDGGGGFRGWHDAAESPNITEELMSRGYDEAALRLLWGGNFLRALRAAEARAE
ncbi:MAG TPA: membrane dipeptidase [Acetobacteraceae bacterium]|nr:membrane dipeptidase [Acetobacteraceae bacterium]